MIAMQLKRYGYLMIIIPLLMACSKPSAREILLNPEHPEWTKTAPEEFGAIVTTSKGDFKLRIVRSWAPIGADRFYNLARFGYYDDSRFYRVVKGFIVQFGLARDPQITEKWLDQTIGDDPVKASNTRGRLAFAFTDPGTRSTQVYISTVDNIRLDSIGFAPFGEVIEGMDIVDKIYSVYGENAGGGVRRGNQKFIIEEGNTHLDEEFPKLDKLLKIEIVEVL
ncbi:MAG: peptidylprolyl isomerase [Cyclobacteriaceae bacterium]